MEMQAVSFDFLWDDRLDSSGRYDWATVVFIHLWSLFLSILINIFYHLLSHIMSKLQ